MGADAHGHDTAGSEHGPVAELLFDARTIAAEGLPDLVTHAAQRLSLGYG